METTRISLDLTYGTFAKLEEVCKEGFQSKSQYLRQLISEDLAKRKRKR